MKFDPLGNDMDPLFPLRFTFEFLVMTLFVAIIIAFFVLFFVLFVIFFVAFIIFFVLFVAFDPFIPFLSVSLVSHLGFFWDSTPDRSHSPYLRDVFPRLFSCKRPRDEVGRPMRA